MIHLLKCLSSVLACLICYICSQPFYHLLVEVSDWSYDSAQPPVAYVAQELLAAPEIEDEGASWGQVRGVCIDRCMVIYT
jgi:heat shock protein HspQ